MFVYRPCEQSPGQFEVGFFAPDGTFNTVRLEKTVDDAELRVHFLNGGQNPRIFEALDIMAGLLNGINESVRYVVWEQEFFDTGKKS